MVGGVRAGGGRSNLSGAGGNVVYNDMA